jgi:multisubunit Na+/H+ antiporter MnhG subunit
MTDQNPEKTFCYRHPDRETLLTCNRCGNPICTECAVLTPTGYRCKDCVRGQQKIFDTAQTIDYVIAVLVAGGIGALAAVLLRLVPFIGFFLILIGPVVGNLIARAVQWSVKRRRSKLLHQVATGAAVIGSLLPQLPLLLLLIPGLNSNLSSLGGSLLSLVWQGLYIFLLASSLYYRLRGIQIR